MMILLRMMLIMMMINYWIIDDGRVWPRKKAMCMSELEDSDDDIMKVMMMMI